MNPWENLSPKRKMLFFQDPQKSGEVLSGINDRAEVFVIGGAQIYQQTIHLADKLYLTHVNAPLPEGGAEVFFPHVDPLQWKEIKREDYPNGAKFPFPFSFVIYERIRPL
jgi:dihydrofolate reductase